MIPGFVIGLLTFPGVILHEWAHKIACNFFGVNVVEVKYFNMSLKLIGGEAGYVRHEIPKRYIETLVISVAPVMVNTLFALFFGYIAYIVGKETGLGILFLWLGFSSGMHAFPSNQDMANVKEHGKKEHTSEGNGVRHQVIC